MLNFRSVLLKKNTRARSSSALILRFVIVRNRGALSLPHLGLGCSWVIHSECQFYSSTSHYSVLGLSSDATKAEIKAAFVSLSKKYHPDKNPESDAKLASEKFSRINEAYILYSLTQQSEAIMIGNFMYTTLLIILQLKEMKSLTFTSTIQGSMRTLMLEHITTMMLVIMPGGK